MIKYSSRTAAVGGVTAGVMVLGSVMTPMAFAADVSTVHDFSADSGGFNAYANLGSVSSGVETGEFCADVTPAAGGVWEIGISHTGITYDRDTTYTVSFDAHATRAVTVPVQGGAGYPAQTGANIELDGTAEPESFTFQVTPGAWPTKETDPASPLAADWTTTSAGDFGFQLNQGEPYTFCFDNFSITSGDGVIVEHSFAGGEVGAFDLYDRQGGGTPRASEDGAATCIDLIGGYANAYEAGLVYRNIAIEQGQNYQLSFSGYASVPRSINVIVGQENPPWGRTLSTQADLTTELQEFTFPFTGVEDYVAEPANPGDPFGRIAFELGRDAAAGTFCITELALVETATAPPPYEPETGPAVRVNQHGYLTEGPKQATLVTDSQELETFTVVGVDGAVVHTGTASRMGIDPSSGLHVQVLDFSDVTTTGEGFTVVADGETSYPFAIGDDLYEQLRYDALNYFYLARSGIDIEAEIVGEEYAREAGHLENPASNLQYDDPATEVDESPNKGDYDVPCLTAAEDRPADPASWPYGEWTCPEGYDLDVIGGWYDAGDHGKYVVNGGISVAQVMGTYERTLYAPTATQGALQDGTLNVPETQNGVPDVLDEAAWELDFMMAMQVPDGTMMNGADWGGMVHHKIHDVGWTGIPLMPANDPQLRRLHRPSTAATLNLAAAAAQGARLFEDFGGEGSPYEGYSAELLEAAETAWDAAVANPEVYAPGSAGNNGGGPYDDSDVSDEFYWAAAELFVTTGDEKYLTALQSNPHHLSVDIFTASGITWGDTAGLGVISLAMVDNDLPEREAVQETLVQGAVNYLLIQQDQAFGTTYPGIQQNGALGYEWGSNSMVVNNQIVLGAAYDLTGRTEFRDAVVAAMDYLLGRNALNHSYITGYGTVYSENQHSRWFANQANAAYPNPPAGSLAGGPNSTQSTWDPTMQELFLPNNVCTPQMCYVDDIDSWASNEITVNWNSALSWVASFVADQDGAAAEQTSGVVTMTPKRILTVPAGTPASDVSCFPVSGAAAGFGVPEDATGVVVNVTTVAPNGPGYLVLYPDTVGNGRTPMPGTSTVNFEEMHDVANSTFVRLPANGDLCYATKGASHLGVVVDISGYVAPDAGIELRVPRRILDSRPATNVGEFSGPLPARTPREIQVAGVGDVPHDAESVIVNVTVTRVSAVGNLRVYPGGGEISPTSTVNYAPGKDKANTTVVALSEAGTITLYSDTDRSVHVIVDVLGWTTDGSSYVGVTPERLLDTRAAEPLMARQVHAAPIRALGVLAGAVPVDATAVVLNVTAINPNQAGNLRVYPDTEMTGTTPPPNASSVNYIPGRDIPNLVVVDLPANGVVNFYSDQIGGTVDIAVDVVGYVTADMQAAAVR